MSATRPQTLVENLARASTRFGAEPLFGTRRDGGWRWTSYREFTSLVDRFRGGLAAQGLGRGDVVAMVADNRLEWAVTAYACYGLGAAVVPMYRAQLHEDWRFIISDCKAKLIVCATRGIYDRCAEMTEQLPHLKQRICMDLPVSSANSFGRLLDTGATEPVDALEPEPTDTATIIYTSGTTGKPKGVVLSHENICSNVAGVLSALPLSSEDRSLSFLPWAHSFGQTCELHAMIRLGASMALCESTDKLMQYLAEVRPTVLISVPQIFNRLYESVTRAMRTKPAVTRKLFDTGIALSKKRRNGALNMAERLALEASDRMVFSQIRARFGGRLKYAFSGGAALSPKVGALIDDIGITVYPGYGLTEAGPVVSANTPRAQKMGSVGKPIRDVRVRIDETAIHETNIGEIVVYSPGVMQRYHDRPSETREAIDTDGGLRTGDLGYLDDDGYLFITGRLKERYKLVNGRYVVPAPLEERLKLSSYIKSAMICGDGREYNVALVVVDIDALHVWATREELSFDDTADMLASSRVEALIMSEIALRSEGFKAYERIRKIALISQDFTPQNGMMTPTQKIRRRAVLARYADRLEALFEV